MWIRVVVSTCFKFQHEKHHHALSAWALAVLRWGHLGFSTRGFWIGTSRCLGVKQHETTWNNILTRTVTAASSGIMGLRPASRWATASATAVTASTAACMNSVQLWPHLLIFYDFLWWSYASYHLPRTEKPQKQVYEKAARFKGANMCKHSLELQDPCQE